MESSSSQIFFPVPCLNNSLHSSRPGADLQLYPFWVIDNDIMCTTYEWSPPQYVLCLSPHSRVETDPTYRRQNAQHETCSFASHALRSLLQSQGKKCRKKTSGGGKNERKIGEACDKKENCCVEKKLWFWEANHSKAEETYHVGDKGVIMRCPYRKKNDIEIS